MGTEGRRKMTGRRRLVCLESAGLLSGEPVSSLIYRGVL